MQTTAAIRHGQPPSGGCVLKREYVGRGIIVTSPAAFRRLCVETTHPGLSPHKAAPAAFRRLCVETHRQDAQTKTARPAAFRRLCVETYSTSSGTYSPSQPPSGGCVLKRQDLCSGKIPFLPAAFRRLCVETLTSFNNLIGDMPAAFRRLCVETPRFGFSHPPAAPSRLQAAVC